MIGRTISHYKILSELGRGGMGVVYKATDTKLERPVALKFLAAHAIEDPEHKARFVREAKAAARLDHQNICPIYEIDEVDGQMFLAMAYLEGQTLKDKIAERPLKLDEALDIAIQTAQGLQAAHQNEVVHRDIKPANLMVTPQGQVKIMDFGLAQLADRSRLTKTTTMLGTPAYMSPEQSQRLPTDRRTDIWSLGVVIYEMVTGRLPFEGERQEAILYAIGGEDPEPITALRVGVPTELDRIVGKAMSKDAGERYQHVEEMIVDLKGLSKTLASGKSRVHQPETPTPSPGVGVRHAAPARSSSPLDKYEVIEELGQQGEGIAYRATDSVSNAPVAIRVLPEEAARRSERRQRKLRMGFIVALAALVASIVMIAALWLRVPGSAPPLPHRKFTFASSISGPTPVISPDGRHIVYRTGPFRERIVWVRDLNQAAARQIMGPERNNYFFWSPDSDFVAFRSGEKLVKVPVDGGPAFTICQQPGNFSGGTWSPDGSRIIFSAGTPARLYQVPAQGGAPEPLFEPAESDSQTNFNFPHFLPERAAKPSILFVRSRGQERRIVIRELDETGRQAVLADGDRPVFSPTGHILYRTAARELWALPFSIDTLMPAGEPFPLRESGSNPSVARDGTLVYVGTGGLERRQLVWRDRRGEKLGVIGQPQEQLQSPALSPDGGRVAVQATENGNQDIWVYDLERSFRTRLTLDPANERSPIWSPNGDQVTFSSNRNGSTDIFTKSGDGGGEAEGLLGAPQQHFGQDWSPDGRYLVYTEVTPEAGSDIWYFQRKGGQSEYEKAPFLKTVFDEHSSDVSPDGRFLAYQSNESGSDEIYIQPFPEGGRKLRVSTNGGQQPRWRSDGRELFFVQGNTLVAASVTLAPSFSVGYAKRLFQAEDAFARRGDSFTGLSYGYDVSADGQ